MKQLDEMERMALKSEGTGNPVVDALLAVMPTIRAALDWRDRGPGQSHCDEEDCPCTSTVCRLKIAVDELRRRLGGE